MVKTKHGEFNVRPITFGERRELHRLEMRVFDDDGVMNKEEYFNLLDWCMNKAFETPEKTLENLDDSQIDEVLNEVYMNYKDITQKKTGKSG